jgi:transposase-like protein/IS1 family transposase
LAAKGQVNCHCCKSEHIKRRGFYQNKNFTVQRFKCLHCGKSFSEETPLDGLRVPMEKVTQTIHLLCEGMGIRAISRFTGLRQKTVLSILEMAGQKAAALLDRQIRDVEVESVQCDEIFSYVFCKEFNNKTHDPEIGTQYTFLAVDRKSKLVMSHLVGKRDREGAESFMADVRKRIKGRSQITTDGLHGYLSGVYNAFGVNVDYASQAKTYADRDFGAFRDERRYSVARGCTTVKTHVHIGWPNHDLISTSHVERMNLSVRLFNRRFTRLTLGYSKKLANLKHSVALFIAHFNFCRIHSAHKQTPAMDAELTNHVWTIEELIGT